MQFDQGVGFVTYRYGHHSSHSGYDRLAEYGLAHYGGNAITVASPLPRIIVRERLLWLLARGTPGYDRAAMSAELRTACQMLRGRRRIFHFLYGETTYRYSGLLSSLTGNPVIASFHQPPSALRLAVQIDWHLRKLSAVVCVGSTQQDYFADIVGPDRVFFVPHGVDIEYFTPPDSFDVRNKDLCLFVGENHRDFATLRGVVELVTFLRPRTTFVAVTSKRSYRLIGSHPSLTFRSDVPESELRDLYRSAALLVMPMYDTTANNAVLESMACGLPMVLSDVGAIRDYVNDESAVLVRGGDARRVAEGVLGLLDDATTRKRMSERCREQAMTFSWPEVVQRLRPVYTVAR